MPSRATKYLLPKWTKRVVTEIGGRDPLGLSRVSQIITDFLLTGIITTTDRARYYSFYCWALWHIDREDNTTKYQDFVDGFRRREAVFALATRLNNKKTSPVGVVAVDAHIEAGLASKKFDCDFRVLPSNAIGGYGQYYAGSLYQLKLTYRQEYGIDKVVEGRAELLAKTFHSSIEKTPYIKNKLYFEKTISLRDLEASKKSLNLDALDKPFAEKEKTLLIDMFFGFENNAMNLNERNLLRRYTLAQTLFIVSEYEKHGCNVKIDKTDNIDRYMVYPTYYYDVLRLDDGKTAPYVPVNAFSECHFLWKQFCLQQFFTQAIESIMFAILETVGSESTGLTLKAAIQSLLNEKFFSTLLDITDNSCSMPYELLNAFSIHSIPEEKSSLSFQTEYSLLNKKSEESILHINKKSPEISLACGVLVLCVLYAKWRGIKNNIGLSYVADNAGSELWSFASFSYIDCWLSIEVTWEEALQDFIEVFILNQHDRIMYEKRRLDSCWLRRIEDRIVKDQDYDPRWRSSRHTNVVSILRDLGLLTIDDADQISISTHGRHILAKVVEERSG